MPKQPDFSGFDDAFKHLTPTEREEADQLTLRYLELVIKISEEADHPDGDLGDERTVAFR